MTTKKKPAIKPKVVAAVKPKEEPKPETLEIIGYRDGQPIYHPVR